MGKILIVLTGGTIGSKTDKGVIDVTKVSSYQLLSEYEHLYGKEIEWRILSPFSILSENSLPFYMESLYRAIREADFEGIDGVIVAHGSDTLSYISAFLGMMFRYLLVPMVIVAANYPLEDERSNGLANFRSAVELIQSKRVNGIFTIYQNNKKENIIYLATRVQEADSWEDQFLPFGGIPFGKIKNGQLIFFRGVQNPSVKEVNKPKERVVAGRLKMENEILFLKSYPGLRYDFISLEKRPKAVVHYLYHSATACIEDADTGKPYSFLNFAKQCREKEIDLYVASLKAKEQALYRTTSSILECEGVIPLYNISSEAAYIKALIAYNQRTDKPVEMMQKNLYYEILKK